MRDTFARTVYEVACAQPKVFMVVADISPAGSMGPFRKDFPDQFVNVGVAEQSMIGLCAGLAMRGATPFAYTIATFAIYRTFEIVRDDLCYQNLPVTVVGIGGGLTYSTLGGTHHAQEDIAVMSALPNMSILAPCDPLETQAATWASAHSGGPVYLRLGKSGEPNLTEHAVDPFEFGKIRYIRRGGDTCVVSYGPILKMAAQVANELEALGRSVSLVSCHTLKPLDREGLAHLMATHSEVVVVEEHSEVGGLAAQMKVLGFDRGIRSDLLTFSLRDEFIHVFGSHEDILAAHGLEARRIVEVVRSGQAQSSLVRR
ncbi:MAG TPA: transketolase C-terminal domain-containing protein [Chloroflexota bacterium]|nr:transketolase C-terminal domain-containing protein [Chloroflexota bacterium]